MVVIEFILHVAVGILVLVILWYSSYRIWEFCSNSKRAGRLRLEQKIRGMKRWQ